LAFTHGTSGYYSSAWKAVKCEDAYNKVVSSRLDKSEHVEGLIFSNISEEEIKLSKEIDDLKDKQNGYAMERIAGLAGVGAVCSGLLLASKMTNDEKVDSAQEEKTSCCQQLEDENVLSQNANIEIEDKLAENTPQSSEESSNIIQQ